MFSEVFAGSQEECSAYVQRYRIRPGSHPLLVDWHIKRDGIHQTADGSQRLLVLERRGCIKELGHKGRSWTGR